MDPLTIGLAAAKIIGGIFGSRTASRQAQNLQIQAAITSNLAKANILRNAMAGYGSALLAANRAGGFSPGTLSNSFSNLAADLQQIAYNQSAQEQKALAVASAGHMSLIGNTLDAFSAVAGDHLKSRKTKIPTAAAPTPYTSNFLDQDWLLQMASPFGRSYP
jgi:hypothetical protein